MGGMSTSLTNDLTKSVKAAARLSLSALKPTQTRAHSHQTKRNLEDVALKCKVDKAIPEATDPSLPAVE